MDITPVLDYLVEIVVAIATPLAMYLIKGISDSVGFKLADDSVETVERYIELGAEAVAGRLPDNVEISSNENVSEIVQWVARKAPKALKKAGLDSNDVRSMITKRLRDKESGGG